MLDNNNIRHPVSKATNTIVTLPPSTTTPVPMPLKQTVIEGSLEIYAKIIKTLDPYMIPHCEKDEKFKELWEKTKILDVQQYFTLLTVITEDQIEKLLIEKYKHLVPQEVVQYIRSLIKILLELYK